MTTFDNNNEQPMETNEQTQKTGLSEEELPAPQARARRRKWGKYGFPFFKTQEDLLLESCLRNAQSLLSRAMQSGASYITLTVRVPQNKSTHHSFTVSSEVTVSHEDYARYAVVELDTYGFRTRAECDTQEQALEQLRALRPTLPRGHRLQVYGLDKQGFIDGYNLLKSDY